VKKILFVNAAEMHRKHPETFHRPSADELQNIGPDCCVKVCANDMERFWVRVTAKDGDIITGEVDSPLLCVPLRFGQKIKVHTDNVYQIYVLPAKGVAQ
jgi:hypothetical protein